VTLALSPHDQSLVAAATRALVSPLVAPSFEHWLGEVNRTLKELLWADKASFMFPLPSGEIRGASDGYTSPELERYMREKLPEIERRWAIRQRSVELGAFNRTLVYGDRLGQLYRSEYYNDYLVPMRAFDLVAMAAAVDAPSRVVILYFHHDRPTGRRFGARGLALVRMLYPAFKAGVHASHMLFLRRDRIAYLADVVAAGVALADGSGRIVHRNPALISMLQLEPDRLSLEAEVSSAARACVAAAWTCARSERTDRQGRSTPRSLRRKVAATCGVYTVTATTLEADPRTQEEAVAVVVERAERAAFPAAVLRRRYGLTPRELDVTRLLAEGASNSEIAGLLAVSPATARHHTEAVMLKLDVHSRARIPTLLATLTAE
jgi:DNA-binding CsgD family transcriptional regulator